MRPAIRQIIFGRSPTFDFRAGILPRGASLARADASTCATRVNAQGLIETVAANVARFTFDPVTLGLQGLLNEASDTNAVINSCALTGTNWFTDASTIVDNAQTSPDGTVNASTVKEDGTTAAHDARYSTVSFVNGSTYAGSAFVKNISGGRWFQLCLASTHAINFNPTTGTLGSLLGIFTTPVAVQYPNGWWRVSVLFPSTATSASGLRQALVPATNSAASASYAGDNTSTLAVMGVHWSAAGATAVGSYIATAGSAVTRAADVLTLATANGTYTVLIQRLNGVTTLTGQVVSGGTGFVVPTDPSPVQRVTLLRTA